MRLESLGATFGVAALCIASACRTNAPTENVNPVGKPAKGSAPASPVSTSNPVAPGFDKTALLVATADCALSFYRAFATTAHAFETAAKAWAASPDDDALRTAARDAFGQAMDAWQVAEMFRFGPANISTEPGGKDLRDQIYAWPLFNRCKVDEVIVDGSYATPAFAKLLVSSRGLGTYEYLAFYEGTDNGCSSFSTINAKGTWAALTPVELRRRKASYSGVVASDVARHADELVTAWDPAGGDFRDELAKAGAGSKLFATNQDAFNAINDALFYVEVEVKDLKLARPLGLAECGTSDCTHTVESLYARRSKENLKRNFQGFRSLFEGCAAPSDLGFDDWLRAAGAGDLADRMRGATTAAESALDAVQPSFEEALAKNPESVRALYTATKGVTDLLKTEFVSDLNLEVPKTSEGDND